MHDTVEFDNNCIEVISIQCFNSFTTFTYLAYTGFFLCHNPALVSTFLVSTGRGLAKKICIQKIINDNFVKLE